ncbi:glycosyltransferase family 2 protein [Candidatus Pseudothioglobus singularis]|nr:glycosyltransferase family 2 protein [Candidatus Pseudothioglobus singularis]
MRVSLIITTYNRPDALLLVLRSIERQITLPYEVIIADDGSTNDTKEVITSFQEKSDILVIHSWQEDSGFRVAKSRNKAISKSNGDYIVLVDGDMILHPEFINDHIDNAQPGYFVQGSRVLLTQDKTKQALNQQKINFSLLSYGLQNRKNAIHSNSLSRLFSNKKNMMRGIKSCNLAFFKQDFVSVNGFNNEFEGWGREDSEFIMRLMNIGINRKNVRFNAIQFHLWHNENIRNSLEKNEAILQNTINNQIKWCDSGLKKFL